MYRKCFALFSVFLLVYQLFFWSIPKPVHAEELEKRYLIGLKDGSTSIPKAIQNKAGQRMLNEVVPANDLEVESEQIAPSILVAELSAAEVQQIQSDPNVEYIEEDPLISIAENSAPDMVANSTGAEPSSQVVPWGIRDIGVETALGQQLTGQGVRIAVLDTGISAHPDLQIAGGISTVEGITSYQDDNGHGTAVAGVIAAQNNQIGIVGVSSGASLYAVKVLDQRGQGRYSYVIQGIEWAIQNHIHLISLSLGGSVDRTALGRK
ncbi:S8 family serine peptidase [Brevibacillus dissolubilis]|uniref:S8 family serine peptidase n=1 Tax=Brevibacillus dissolubilis TaxID=1844116 RepID=UPI00159B8A18|nr:S8 family serine peptidase [Brevibacillus dissolubilis]